MLVRQGGAALASDARQAGDDELLKMATRIKARAIRRSGELLKQIAPDRGGLPSETRAGDHPGFSHGEAAREAGMSRHQQTQALRVAAAHRSQSDWLEIEAAAMCRLADEYDGAQGRGVIIGAQDGARKRVGDVNATAITAGPGLRRDQIHAARLIRP